MRVANCQVMKKWYFRTFFPIQSVVDFKKKWVSIRLQKL